MIWRLMYTVGNLFCWAFCDKNNVIIREDYTYDKNPPHNDNE